MLESLRPIAAGDDDARIAHLGLDRWVDYPRAARLLQLFNDMHDTPQRNRMPCLLLHGDSGMGKRMVIAKFRRAHSPVYDPRNGIEHHSVIAMEMPAAPLQRRFYA